MVGAVTWKIWFKKEKGEVGPSKNLVGQNVLLEREDKPEMGGGGRGVVTFFHYFTVQFSHIYFVWGDLQSLELVMQDFHPCSHSSLVLKPGIIFAFLIHSGRLQKMLSALFNLVWNAQKSKWTIFFECQGKVFLSIAKVLEKVSEDQL